jgi:hypothetical protein
MGTQDMPEGAGRLQCGKLAAFDETFQESQSMNGLIAIYKFILQEIKALPSSLSYQRHRKYLDMTPR